jgi:hypothetical protein
MSPSPGDPGINYQVARNCYQLESSRARALSVEGSVVLMFILSFPSLASTSSSDEPVQAEEKGKKTRTPTPLNDPFSSFPTPRRLCFPTPRPENRRCRYRPSVRVGIGRTAVRGHLLLQGLEVRVACMTMLSIPEPDPQQWGCMSG